MAGTSPSEDLGAFLTQLKERSGHSYQWIGQKVNAGKSTVHRYCAGLSVPQEFGTVERIARACNADKDEMARLYRLWTHATAGPGRSGPAPAPADSAAAADTEPEVVSERAVPETSPSRPAGRLKGPKALRLLGAGLIAVCVLALLVGTGSPHPPSRSGPPWVSGPTWRLPPAAVPRTLFGVTLNSATGSMPAFRTGAVRLWDSGTRWAQIQPERGEFDWSVLDRHVRGAEEAGLPVLYVLGGTPAWAAKDGPLAPYPDGSRAAPPNSLADWDAFVRALVTRYHGHIEAYELWVLGTDRRFFTGSVSALVEMTRRASRIIRGTDPAATVVCPGMGNLWSPEGRQVLRRFAELGGYAYCDVAGIKLHQRSATDPPETMLELAATIDRELHQAGVHPRLWSTGTTYSIPLQGSLDDNTARAYAVRFFLVGLFARDLNLERMYFYNWGGTRIPIVLQAEGGSPTRAALAVEQLQRWLAHAQSRSCGHGQAAGLPANVWQCEFTVSESRHRHNATIRWTHTGTAETTAGPGTRAVRRLDGTLTPAEPGDTIPVAEEPILIEAGP